ncbi:class I SAM-dependent methyltransferase [Catenuloplanes indicus JCM 9534]
MVRAVLEATPGERPDVLDVGCGTGISSRPFLRAGCRVHGVEPDPRMAALARRDGIEVDESTFEAWEPHGRTVDLVVAGQAWHWVDPVAGARRAAEVLRPGGRIALFWNGMQPEPAVAETFARVNAEVLPELPRLPASAAEAYAAMGATAADGLRAAAAFTEPEEWRFESARRYTRDEWLDLVPTQGFYTRLPPDRLRPLLDRIGAAIDGVVTVHVTTLVVTASRRA